MKLPDFKMIEHMGKVVPVTRLCFLEPGDRVNYCCLDLLVVSVNGVIVFRSEDKTLYVHRPSAKSQEWVEILKKQTNEKNVKTGF